MALSVFALHQSAYRNERIDLPMRIKKELLSPDRLKPVYSDPLKLDFGKNFTDHMFSMDYTPSEGWKNPMVKPYQPLVLDPATVMLPSNLKLTELSPLLMLTSRLPSKSTVVEVSTKHPEEESTISRS